MYLLQAFEWWITPQRLMYYFLLRIVRRCVIPFIRLALIIVIKKFIIGALCMGVYIHVRIYVCIYMYMYVRIYNI